VLAHRRARRDDPQIAETVSLQVRIRGTPAEEVEAAAALVAGGSRMS
jgi:hypothetical protein